MLTVVDTDFLDDEHSSDTAINLVARKRGTVETEALLFLRDCAVRGITPFVGCDSSVGMEYEMQVAVEGRCEAVDLPLKISNSTYFQNVLKRAERGDLSRYLVDGLKNFLYKNDTNIWENSWVRFSIEHLREDARQVLMTDLLADKRAPELGQRKDRDRFFCDETTIRIPVSYLLKLAMVDAFAFEGLAEPLQQTARKLSENLLSDNTSPEILSFTIPQAGKRRIGDLAAAETARTLLVTQLLTQYANRRFGLLQSGQKALIYFAPHAPTRQKKLNELVPDSYYRHLFMSPCLSGWDRGEDKHSYMGVCHRTLSRSQLNTIGKLKDAGILVNNLVTLPNTSNTCLANNGIHVSLGSKVLTYLAGDALSGYTPEVEKNCGDLAIKIVEHFLPLFVGTYSAAPYRIDFKDFHPENVLGFLPHELDFTHLRMLWRRWKKKAKIGFLGRSFTPFGPRWLDVLFARIFRLKGDLVPDFRLIDYLVCLLSTDTCPALNGILGNHERLKSELMEMGVFDRRMSIYLLYRQRIFKASGYSGFEGRSYSLFPTLLEDMAEAVELQNFISALAYRAMITERVTHQDIPDTPSVESERRQIFFGSAIGIPTFYVHAESRNIFLKRILEHTESVRRSGRYRGYLRVKNREYRLALLQFIREEYADLVAEMKMAETLQKLEDRLCDRHPTAMKKIVDGVRRTVSNQKKVLNMNGDSFNMAAESYFRKGLRQDQMKEGLQVLLGDCRMLEEELGEACNDYVQLPGNENHGDYVRRHYQDILNEEASEDVLCNILKIWLFVINQQQRKAQP